MLILLAKHYVRAVRTAFHELSKAWICRNYEILLNIHLLSLIKLHPLTAQRYLPNLCANICISRLLPKSSMPEFVRICGDTPLRTSRLLTCIRSATPASALHLGIPASQTTQRRSPCGNWLRSRRRRVWEHSVQKSCFFFVIMGYWG